MNHASLPFLRLLVRPLPSRHLLPLSGRARGAALGFRPMAVLRDQAQAYKSEPKMSAAPAAPQARESNKPAQVAPVTAPASVAEGPSPHTPRFFRPAALKQSLSASAPSARFAPLRPVDRLTLSGKFSDVCAELERLVAQEERYLQAG